MPANAVKIALQRDGLDSTLTDLDLNKSVASQMKKVDDDPPLTNDPKLAKCHKMLNVVSSGYSSVVQRFAPLTP